MDNSFMTKEQGTQFCLKKFIYMAALCSMLDPTFLTKDQTCTPCIRSVVSLSLEMIK